MTLARLLTVALVATFGAPAAAEPRHEKLDKSLRQTVERGCVGTKSVIIRTKPGYREALRNRSAQGREVKGEFPALDAITADVRCEDLEGLGGFAGDRFDFGQRTRSRSSAERCGQQSGDAPVAERRRSDSARRQRGARCAAVAGDIAFDDARGAAASVERLSTTPCGRHYRHGHGGQPPSIGIAIIDSGIQAGIDFGSRISAFYDFTHGDIRVTSPTDEYGHGRHVAGLAAGTYVGVAPTARLIGLKVLNDKGRASTDKVIRAIEFAIVNKDLLRINVLNLSLGHPIFESAATDPLVQAVEHAARAGLIVVVSAGNFGTNPRPDRWVMPASRRPAMRRRASRWARCRRSTP